MFFILSADAGEGVHEFDADVRKAVHELYREIFAVVHKLPFSDVIGEGGYRLHFEVRKGGHHLYFDVREGVYHPHPSGEADVFEITVPVNGTCRLRCASCQQEKEQCENAEKLFHREPPFSKYGINSSFII
jgi:hypothetical protein